MKYLFTLTLLYSLQSFAQLPPMGPNETGEIVCEGFGHMSDFKAVIPLQQDSKIPNEAPSELFKLSTIINGEHIIFQNVMVDTLSCLHQGNYVGNDYETDDYKIIEFYLCPEYSDAGSWAPLRVGLKVKEKGLIFKKEVSGSIQCELE